MATHFFGCDKMLARLIRTSDMRRLVNLTKTWAGEITSTTPRCPTTFIGGVELCGTGHYLQPETALSGGTPPAAATGSGGRRGSGRKGGRAMMGGNAKRRVDSSWTTQERLGTCV